MKTLIIMTSLVAVSWGAALKPLKNWTICPKSDPNYSVCLKGAMQDAIRELKGGNRKLGVMPLDPLHFDKLEIKQDDGPIPINLKFEDIDVNGLSNVVIDSFKVDWDTYHMDIDLHLDETAHNLNVIGKYEVNGKILALPILGKGACNLTLDNLKADVSLDAKPMMKDGVKYLDFTEGKVHATASKMHIYLENLFNGDKALGDQMNLFLNENWKEILEELMPAISRAFSLAFTSSANAVFHHMPLEEIFHV